MANATNYLEELIGGHLLATATWAKPTGNKYIMLFSAVSDIEAGTGTELSYTNYARQPIAIADASWTPPSGGNQLFSNAITITFPASASADQTATHFGIADAVTAGNIEWIAPLDASVVMANGGDDAEFIAGALGIQFSTTTDYLTLQIGNHWLRTNTWVKPTTLTGRLYSTAPAQDGTGGVELAAGGYTPPTVGPGDASWNLPSGGNGLYTNAVEFAFGSPTATWTYDTFGVTEGSNILFFFALSQSYTRLAGSSSVRYKPTELSVTIT